MKNVLKRCTNIAPFFKNKNIHIKNRTTFLGLPGVRNLWPVLRLPLLFFYGSGIASHSSPSGVVHASPSGVAQKSISAVHGVSGIVSP